MNQTKPRVGIAGLGRIATTHATAFSQLADRVELVAVCDTDGDIAAAFAQQFDCRAMTDLQAMIDSPDIDALDLILPHHLHLDAAMATFDAGKHLLIEKPVGSNYADSAAIVKRAAEVGVHFMVAENTRYVAAYQAVEKLLREGAIGDVIHAQTALRSNEKKHLAIPNDWRTRFDMGGGLILDTGAHSFYLLAWLLGEFESVNGIGKNRFTLNKEIEDTAQVDGAMRSGAHYCCTFTSVAEIPHSERLELYGTHGGILMDQMSDPVVKVFKGNRDFQGYAVPHVPFGPDGWHPGGWHWESVITEVTDFVDSLTTGRPPLIDSGQCAYAIKIVDAAYQSIRSGETVTFDDEPTAVGSP